MAYEVALLKTVVECDSLLNVAASEKIDLNYRVMGLQREQSSVVIAAPAVDSKLAILDAEILGYKAKMADPATPSSEKDALNGKLQSALTKRTTLMKKDEDYNSVSALKRVSFINRAQKELAELDALIQEVTTHKATL